MDVMHHLKIPACLLAVLSLASCSATSGGEVASDGQVVSGGGQSERVASGDTLDTLPPWDHEALVAATVEPHTWPSDSARSMRVEEVRLLAWRTHEQYCRDRVTGALLWVRLEKDVSASRWALFHVMRWPPEGERWGGDRDPSWSEAHYVHRDYDAVRIFDHPPGNEEIYELWPPRMFGVGEGWPILTGQVRSRTWRSLTGEEPVYAEFRLSSPTASPCPTDS